MKSFALICLVILAALSAAAALPDGPKVLLLYDMEGVTGASSVRHVNFGDHPEYTAARRSLTDDVNATIAGLKAAGAAEIVVVDGHGSGNGQEPDVFEAELLPPAKMIERTRPFDIYMDSYDQSFDAIVAVAMHAGAGNPDGFLAHTYAIQDIGYRVNGIPFNESMILATGAARVGIPLIMVCGDDVLETEIRRFLPWIEYATVKRAESRARAEPLPRAEASRRIEEAARKALQALDRARLPEIARAPYRFVLTFQNDGHARAAAMLQGAEALPDTPAVQIRADDFENGYRRSLDLISMAGLALQLQSARAAIQAQPNAEAIQEKVGDIMTERWLQPPVPAPPTPPAPPRRYYGAR